MAVPHAEQVEFEGVRGPVSAARSDAILVQLEGKNGDSDLLQIHLAFEQSINADSPLVLGNKLTLLQNGPATYHGHVRGDSRGQGQHQPGNLHLR